MRISDLRRHRSPLSSRALRVSARVDRLGRPPVRLWFDLPPGLAGIAGCGQDSLAEAFVVALLPHAAHDAARFDDAVIVVEGPLSQSVGRGVERVSGTWAGLRRDLGPVSIQPTSWHVLPPLRQARPTMIASFDPAGLYTFGQRRDGGARDRLLTLWPHGGLPGRRSLQGRLDDFARRFDLPGHVIASNLGHIHPVYRCEWDGIAGGVARIAAGHLMGRQAGDLVLPAPTAAWGDTLRARFAAVEPLLGSERLRPQFHGGEVAPVERLDWVAGRPYLLRALTVCDRVMPGRVNCGRCADCHTAMLALDALGLIDLPVFDWDTYHRRQWGRGLPASLAEGRALRGVMSFAADRGRADLVALGRHRLQAANRRRTLARSIDGLGQAPLLWRLRGPLRHALFG